MSASEFVVLRDLFLNGQSSISEIVARTDIAQSRVSICIKQLVARGWVLTTTDPADGRKTLASVTERVKDERPRRRAMNAEDALAPLLTKAPPRSGEPLPTRSSASTSSPSTPAKRHSRHATWGHQRKQAATWQSSRSGRKQNGPKAPDSNVPRKANAGLKPSDDRRPVSPPAATTAIDHARTGRPTSWSAAASPAAAHARDATPPLLVRTNSTFPSS
jgi:DNA-binding MarR family transcriptional regulator